MDLTLDLPHLLCSLGQVTSPLWASPSPPVKEACGPTDLHTPRRGSSPIQESSLELRAQIDACVFLPGGSRHGGRGFRVPSILLSPPSHSLSPGPMGKLCVSPQAPPTPEAWQTEEGLPWSPDPPISQDRGETTGRGLVVGGFVIPSADGGSWIHRTAWESNRLGLNPAFARIIRKGVFKAHIPDAWVSLVQQSLGPSVAVGLESWWLLPVWERPQRGRTRLSGSSGATQGGRQLGWAACPTLPHSLLFLRWKRCQASAGTCPLHPGPWPLGEPRV